MPQPCNPDIERFIGVFEILSSFEAQHRTLRNWGAFGPSWPRPDPSCVRVLDWLKDLISPEVGPMVYPEAVDIPPPAPAHHVADKIGIG